MKPVDDGLFAHIKERLREHEEAYRPGAWERFEKKEKKKTVWFWFAALSSAAAVLLIGFTLFYTGDKTQNNGVQQQVKNTPSKEKMDTVTGTIWETQEPLTAIENLKPEVAGNKNIIAPRTNNNIANGSMTVAVQQPSTVEHVVVPAVQPSVSSIQGAIANPNVAVGTDKKDVRAEAVRDGVLAKANVIEKDSVKVNKTRSFQEFLDDEVKSNRILAAGKSSAKKVNRWELGLMIVPSIGNTRKLNMGYGVSMGYALSDKVSISSGISYNEMAASKSVGRDNNVLNSPSNMAIVNDTKSLKSVDANLAGIDIPLGIKYYLSKKFYTNVGVSAFAVLNQKQNNNYVQGSVEYATDADQTNAAGFKAVFQERDVSEPVPSGEVRGDKYLGFYNVSFGFKQQISGSKAFSVEPFMKLPMKEFTKENLYLIGTGVRLKFDF